LIVLFCASVSHAQDFEVSKALEYHVWRLCDESLGGRKAGSSGEREAASYLYNYLKKNGVVMMTDSRGQDFTIAGKDTLSSLNVVGMVEGSDPELKNEYIVVGANIDNLGSNILDDNGQKVVQIYPGADANASGVAILMELAKLVAAHSYMFPRSIIFVGFGAAEMGFAGSWYFANRAFGQISSVKAMINLHMLGRGKDGRFSVFSQMPLRELTEILDQTRQEPVVIFPVSAPKEVQPSDHLPFYDLNIPVVCFSTGKSNEFRTLRDSPELLSYYDMELECNYLFYFLKTLASQNVVPAIKELELKDPSQDGGDKIYSAAALDKRPEYLHSDERQFLETWVYKYLKYPRAALSNGIQGKVLVSFVVEKNGMVTNVEVISGVDDDLDAEAVRVVSVSPKWSPGQIKGEKVRSRVVLPIEFRLTTSSPQFRIKR